MQNPSDVVKKHVGTPGVAEPSALLAAGATELVIPKRIYTEPGAGRSMTFAVARIPFAKRQTEARPRASETNAVGAGARRGKEGGHG
jgi:cobalt-precorrin 5A hydrolase